MAHKEGQHTRTDERTGAKHSAAPLRRGPRLIVLIPLIVVVVIAVVYLAGVALFSHVLFVPGTRVNGEDVSLTPVSEVAAHHSEATTGYALAVSGQGVSLTIPASNVGLSTDGDAYAEAALAQINPWLWPALSFSERALSVEVVATYDEGSVSTLVGSVVEAVNQHATPSTDARAAYDEATKRYVVVPEQLGTELDAEAVTERVDEALRTLEDRVRLSEDVLVRPRVSADDAELTAAVEEVNGHLGAIQTLTVGGTEVRVVDEAQIAQWVAVGEDLAVSVDASAITTWAQGDLSKELDSTGSARTYTRPDGKVASVVGGTYGWTIGGAELARQMAANIESGTEATIEVPMLQTAATWNPGGQDWGARYVDIDLSEQHVRFYDDAGALVWESDCVTGNSSKGNDTPTGVYAINGNMESGDVELRGKIDPATNEPEYISHVAYWMPFIDNLVALHDAPWRGSFGGTIYRDNGSHGCVNLPSDAAASLYGLVHVGDVVVVHG